MGEFFVNYMGLTTMLDFEEIFIAIKQGSFRTDYCLHFYALSYICSWPILSLASDLIR